MDNIEKILPLLEFKENWVYEVLILQRKKDNPDVINNQSVRIIKSYTISSKETLVSKYDEMKKLADLFNARVYIKLQPYNIDKVGFKLMEVLLQKMQNKDYSYQSLLTKALGNMSPEKKIWIVDVDYENVSSNDILRIKTVLNDCEPNGRNIIGEIPTPNGIHIITRPFNTQQFLTHQDVFYKCEIKKNNPTILYSNLNKNL
jgi:hypothetical protein